MTIFRPRPRHQFDLLPPLPTILLLVPSTQKSPGDRRDQASPLSALMLVFLTVFLAKLTGVVCHCLPLGVFSETPSLSVDVLHRPSFRLLVSGTRIYRRGLGRPPRTLLSTGVPREGGVVGIWVVEAFRDAYHPITL